MGCGHYFTAKYDFIVLKVRFKLCFYSQEYNIITKLALLWLMKVIRLSSCAILSEQNDWLSIGLAYFILESCNKNGQGTHFLNAQKLLKSMFIDV